MKAVIFQKRLTGKNGKEFTAYTAKLTDTNGQDAYFEARVPKDSIPDNGGMPVEVEIPSGAVSQFTRTYTKEDGTEAGVTVLCISQLTITDGLLNPFDTTLYI